MGGATIRRTLTTIGTMASRPAAFLLVPGYGVLWYLLQPATFDWSAVATLSVWLMTLFILTLIFNVIAIRFVRKYRQVYE